jgi:hypothetical protein
MRGGVKSLPASKHQSFCHNFPQLSSKEEQGEEHGTTIFTVQKNMLFAVMKIRLAHPF